MNNKQKILLFNEIDNTFLEETITEITENKIETKEALYTREDFQAYFNESNNTMTYISKIDIQGKIEANNLKKLRRSEAINNMFDYETTKQFDLMAFMPYIIIIIMAIFM